MDIEKLTFGASELATALGYEPTTVKRLMTQHPDRLPPAVVLAMPGKKGKRVWLRTTVAGWLKEREMVAIAPISALDQLVKTPAFGTNGGCGRGRPRKLESFSKTGGSK
ncbi:MAG: hypothetical protein KBF98_16525 [Rhodoferax sp.]|nr:hypothetical protein [Rhodoferax sp.]